MKMESENKRQSSRVDLASPISYMCIDSSGQQFSQNMGVARNVSREGMHIETFSAIDTDYLMLAFTDQDRNIVEIKGEVIYSRANNSGMYNTGVRFSGRKEENISFIKELVMSYHTSVSAKRRDVLSKKSIA